MINNPWKDINDIPEYDERFNNEEFEKFISSKIIAKFKKENFNGCIIDICEADPTYTIEGNEHIRLGFVHDLYIRGGTHISAWDIDKWCYEEDLIKQSESK